MDSWLLAPQRRLHGTGTVALLVFTAFVTPASLDMYTPALPQMVSYFGSDEATLNLTLVGFYVFFALGQLLLGPASDRFGRRPLFLAGSVVYLMGSAACAVSDGIAMLAFSRIVQAVGAGAIAAISMALVKDVFVPEKRDLAFSVITSLFGVGPVVAPMLGAALMQIGGWRAIFWVLILFGAGCLAFAMLLEEPLGGRDGGKESGSAHVVGSLAAVLGNKGFTEFMMVAALFSLPFMSYVAVASHIYVTYFGLSEMEYGIYFGIASAMMIVGPFLWPAMRRFMNARGYTTFLIAGAGVVGVLLLTVGSLSPVLFCTSFALFMLMEASVRTFSANILLAQQSKSAGAAAALVNCSHTLLGTVGMMAAVLPWPTYLVGLGALTLVSLGAAGAIWFLLLHSDARLDGVK